MIPLTADWVRVRDLNLFRKTLEGVICDLTGNNDWAYRYPSSWLLPVFLFSSTCLINPACCSICPIIKQMLSSTDPNNFISLVLHLKPWSWAITNSVSTAITWASAGVVTCACCCFLFKVPLMLKKRVSINKYKYFRYSSIFNVPLTPFARNII